MVVKHIYFTFLFVVLTSQQIFGQNDCIDADPFCTGTSYTFNNSTNGSNFGSVDCLGSTPNPTWYYMEVNQNGQMGFTISQTGSSGGGLDVDFALWGPYSSLAAGCGNPFPNGTPIDCSYSSAAIENVTIPNAQVGETYILLITNYSNQPGTITFAQTSGSGTSDCSFTCGVNMTTDVEACNSNLYDINGTLNVSAGPGISVPNSGTLTISNSCGGSQTYNAPFTNIPYSFTGLNANGGACTITASFSNFPDCNTFVQYTAPPSCVTPCNISVITSNTGACVNGSYNLSGSITFTNSPTTGTLTVTGSCGGTQTFSAPFTSPVNYNLLGINANGAGCTVTATFSDNATCTNTANYTAPVLCACTFTGFTGSTSNCDATTNTYSFSGTIDFIDPPATGTLTLTNSCGGVQTFTAPFGTSQSFTFTNLPANGSPCTISAGFSDDGSCSATLDYTAVPACNCQAEVGTYTPDVIGNSNTLTILCFGDTIDIVSDNNWTAPDEIVGTTDPTSPNYDPSAPIYDPGIAWLIYSCPPSVAVTPADAEATNTDINDDPCLISVVGNTPDIWDVNDLSIINALPAGTFTNNTVYFVPITMYSLQDGIYSYVVLPALQCYELGTPIAVQYLPEITSTQTQNCANGTVSVTVNGGSPALNGNNFNIDPSSLTPNTASVVGGTTSNGGTLSIGNLQDGAYSFDVVDDNGCPITISGTFVGPQTASISYPDNLYCVTDPNPNPTQTGTNGGSYSSGPGLSLDANTGEINLVNSTPGSYTITYTTPGPDCPATSSYSLIVDENPVVDAGPDVTVCYGNQVTLVAEGAEFYTWNMGLENGVPYLPSIGINEFDVVGVNAAGCIGYDTVIVEVLDDCFPDDELFFWVPNTFTPDNDQYNQNWNVVFYSGIDPLSFELYVFNRWGEIVWESRNPEIGWDGTYFNGRKCPDGVYTWKIKFKKVQTNEKRTAVGHVNLLR